MKKRDFMKKLEFQTVLKEERYGGDFCLPDYVYDKNGEFSREKTLETVVKEEYGEISPEQLKDLKISASDITDRVGDLYNGYLACGKAFHDKIEFTFERKGKKSSFIVDILKPVKVKNPDFVVQLDFVSGAPTKYFPHEELMDRGIAVAHVNYKEITSDDGDFENGIAGLFERSDKYAAGKLRLWAFAANAIGEFLLEKGYTAKEKLYVAGHSRLGKTSLLTCAIYEIFAGCFVNCSGCSGAAVTRAKTGETIEKICEVFPYWFCGNYKNYVGRENEMPFDQHYLLSAVFPRKAFIVAASEDDWADTSAQYLCAEAASVVYEKAGKTGLTRLKSPLLIGEKNDKGDIKFFIRDGVHYFSREDWNFYIDCLNG